MRCRRTRDPEDPASPAPRWRGPRRVGGAPRRRSVSSARARLHPQPAAALEEALGARNGAISRGARADPADEGALRLDRPAAAGRRRAGGGGAGVRGGAGGAEAAARRRPPRAAGALDACAKWHTNECARSQLPLQRLALQYPEALPPDLLARLRAAVSNSAPPPGEGQIRDPWSFGDTENQRMIAMARSLVGQVVAGTPDSPTARGLGRFRRGVPAGPRPRRLVRGGEPGVYRALDHRPAATRGSRAAGRGARSRAPAARRAVGRLGAAAGGGLSGGAEEPHVGRLGAQPPEQPVAGVGLAGRRASAIPGRSTSWTGRSCRSAATRSPRGWSACSPTAAGSAPYEIRARRKIAPAKRRDYDAALYGYATPDYILGVSQSVDGLALRVSGGQEIVATLYAESPAFAPLYLWSRTRTPKSNDADAAQHARSGGGEPQPRARPPGHAGRRPGPRLPVAPLVRAGGDGRRRGVALRGRLRRPGHPGRVGGGAGDREVPRLLQRRQRAGAGTSPAPGWRCRAASRPAWRWWRAAAPRTAISRPGKRRPPGRASRWARTARSTSPAATAPAPISSPAVTPGSPAGPSRRRPTRAWRRRSSAAPRRGAGRSNSRSSCSASNPMEAPRPRPAP